MSFEWFVALRYLREGRVQTGLILLGVAVGVGIIVFLSALISGLQATLIDNTLGSQPHVIVSPPDDVARPVLARPPAGAAVAARVERIAQRTRSIEQWQEAARAVDGLRGVVATSPVVAGAAFARRGDASRAVALRGIDAERFERVIHLRRRIEAGAFRVAGAEAVVGVGLARDLGVGVGDKLRLDTALGRGELVTVSGLFDLGVKDVNERWVLVSLATAQNLLDLPGGVTTIEARVARIFDARAIAARAAERTGLRVESWMDVNRQLLVGLNSQSASSAMIQVFVAVAVALGIASVLIVSVVQKSREIGILKAFGTGSRAARRVFLIQGGLLGLTGSILGCGLGALLGTFFASLATNPDGSPTFPVDLSWTRYLTASALATLTGLVSAVAPARRAAALDPAVAVRHV